MAIRNIPVSKCAMSQGTTFGLDEQTFSAYLNTRYDSIAQLTDNVDNLQTFIDDLNEFLILVRGEGTELNDDAMNFLGTLGSLVNNWEQLYSTLSAFAQQDSDVDVVFSMINGLLPSQSGQAGKYLRTNGANVSWHNAYAEDTGNAPDSLISTAEGTIQSYTLVAETVFDIQMMEGESLTLHVNGGSTFATHWPSDVKWLRGSAPVLEASEEVLIFWKLNGVTYGSHAGMVAFAAIEEPVDPPIEPPVVVPQPIGIIDSVSFGNEAAMIANLSTAGDEGRVWAVAVFTGGTDGSAALPNPPTFAGYTMPLRAFRQTSYTLGGSVTAIYAAPVPAGTSGEFKFEPWQSAYGHNKTAVFTINGMPAGYNVNVEAFTGEPLSTVALTNVIDDVVIFGGALPKFNSLYADVLTETFDVDYGNIVAWDGAAQDNLSLTVSSMHSAVAIWFSPEEIVV